MSDGSEDIINFYVNFARAYQDHSFGARIQTGTPRDNQRNENGKCLMGKKKHKRLLCEFLRAPVKITFLPQGSKLGRQGTAKGIKIEMPEDRGWAPKKRIRRSKPKGLGTWRVLPPNNTEMINVDHLAKAVSHPKVASKISPRSYPRNLAPLCLNITQRHERPLASTMNLSLPWGFATMDPQFS